MNIKNYLVASTIQEIIAGYYQKQSVRKQGIGENIDITNLRQ